MSLLKISTSKVFSTLLIFTSVLIPLSTASLAQSPQSIDPKKEADIRKLIELTDAAALSSQLTDQIFNQLAPVIQRAYPQVPSDVMAVMMEELRAELSTVDLIEPTIPIYARHFTTKEINELIAFYRTPLGQRVIETLPLITQESFEAGVVIGKQASQRAMKRVFKRLKEQGYSPARSPNL